MKRRIISSLLAIILMISVVAVGTSAAAAVDLSDYTASDSTVDFHIKEIYSRIDVAEYRALVREAKTRGAHFIKLMISGLMDFSQYGVLTGEPLPPDLIRDMIACAHDEGFSVMAHANGDEAVRAALAGGVDSIEHGAYLTDETLCQLAESRAVWVPTLVTIGNLIGCGRFPDEVLKPLLAYQRNAVKKAAALGAKIACGSDAGAYRVLHGQGGMDERALLRRILGEGADAVLDTGNTAIMARF